MVVTTSTQVLITHPGRQHSHQAALALAEAGILAGYWAGVPATHASAPWLPRSVWSRYEPAELAATAVIAVPWVPALRRIGDRLPRRLAARVDFLACRAFDRWVASRLDKTAARAVIACEISARLTFESAKRRGMRTFLDAPSIHHLAQDRVQPTRDHAGLHEQLASIKDAEIALADHVLTVSDLARHTYLDVGAPPERVHAIPLGADPSVFAVDAADAPVEDPLDSAPIRFLFAGATIHRKGFDLLIDAFARVRAGMYTATLDVVGPPGDAASLALSRSQGVRMLGPLPQRGLAALIRSCDLLVLPSRHDSYGMVVIEALASGKPVIVSDMVGAKDLVRNGSNGWIVPMGDVSALERQMRWCAEHVSEVRTMRASCIESARSATWDAYRARFSALIRRLLEEPAKS